MFLNKEKVIICKSSEEYKRYKDMLFKSGKRNAFIGEKNITFLSVARDVVLRHQAETGQNSFPAVIPSKDLITVIYLSFLQAVSDGSLLFFKKNMITYSLADKVYQTIKKVCSENVFDAFINIENPKITDIVNVLKRVDAFYSKLGETNGVLYLSEEQLYTKAVNVLKEHGEYIDKSCEYEYIGNGEISVLQKELLSFYIPNVYVEEKELLSVEALSLPFSSVSVQRSYGNFNEIYGVIKDIIKNKYTLSDVALYLTSNDLLVNVLSSLEAVGIPYKCICPSTEGTGQIYYVISELFKIKYRFITHERAYGVTEKTPDSEKYVDYLIQIRNSDSVNAHEFINNTSEFIEAYFKSEDSKNVYKALCETAKLVPKDFIMSHRDVKSLVLNTVQGCSSLKNGNERGILVGTLYSNVSEARKHLYIIGMDSSSFGVKEGESPIMSDDELKAIGVRDTRFNTASRSQEKEYSALSEIINSSSIIGGSTLFVSYVAFDSVAMMYKNPSSFVLKLKEARSINNELTASFSDKLILSKTGNELQKNTDDIPGVKEKTIKDIILSATSVKAFTDCQRKFYYLTVLKLKVEPDNDVKLGIWLEPNIKGEFVHEVLKEYIHKAFINNVVSTLVPDKQKMQSVIDSHTAIDKTLLNSIIENIDKKYLYLYPALDEVHSHELNTLVSAVSTEIEHIISNLKNSYPVAAEWESDEEMRVGGMAFSQKSRIDRIDYNISDSSYTVIDYKVKSTKSSAAFKDSHTEVKDVAENNNIQEYLYYLIVNEYLKKHGIKGRVKSVIFRLVLTGEEVAANNLVNARQLIEDKVKKIREAVESAIYESSDDVNTTCRYCDFKYICRDLTNVSDRENEENTDE